MTHDKWIKLMDNEKRIEVAQLCGWNFHKVEGAFKFLSVHPSGDTYKTQFGDLAHLPDYLNDLNAMHEAERSRLTTVTLQARYVHILRDISHDLTWTQADGWACFATARQRAEAFVLTLEKQ
jgi:hypothetical protein